MFKVQFLEGCKKLKLKFKKVVDGLNVSVKTDLKLFFPCRNSLTLQKIQSKNCSVRKCKQNFNKFYRKLACSKDDQN